MKYARGHSTLCKIIVRMMQDSAQDCYLCDKGQCSNVSHLDLFLLCIISRTIVLQRSRISLQRLEKKEKTNKRINIFHCILIRNICVFEIIGNVICFRIKLLHISIYYSYTFVYLGKYRLEYSNTKVHKRFILIQNLQFFS